MTEKATRLYPLPPRGIPAESIYEDLELPPSGLREASRPYVIVNMVSSVDGKTAIGGKSTRIGSQTDRQTMRNLRSHADAVMIGAGTLRAERLSLAVDESPGDPPPLAVIVSRTGDVALQNNLIVGEGQEVFVITPQDSHDDRLHDRARVLRVPATRSGDVALAEALKILKSEHTVDVLLVEGGPSLNHSLISANLADELFLTLAPKLLGGTPGETRTLLDGPPLVARDMKLLSAYLAGDELFLRYDCRRRSLAGS